MIWISDTEARPPRCPPSVLHRALQYDIQGTKTGRLWIDQECIDQDDVIDRDEHIAHMHRIYERSKCTGIVLSQSISSSQATLLQRCIEAHEKDILDEALNNKMEEENRIDTKVASGAAAAPISLGSLDVRYRSSNLEYILEEELEEYEDDVDTPLHTIFKSLVEDTYFTRAWTYQEQSCSKISCYLIPILPDPPSHKNTSGRERTSIFMPSTLPQSIDRWCCENLRSIYLSSVLSNNFDFRKRETVVKDEVYQPSEWERIRIRNHEIMDTVRGMNTRSCKYVADRVTIVANICEFGITLRTTQFQDDEAVSYSTCVLALLIMNGVFDRWAVVMKMEIDSALRTL